MGPPLYCPAFPPCIVTRRETGSRCFPPGEHVAQRRGSSEGPDRGAARAARGTGAAPGTSRPANHQNGRVRLSYRGLSCLIVSCLGAGGSVFLLVRDLVLLEVWPSACLLWYAYSFGANIISHLVYPVPCFVGGSARRVYLLAGVPSLAPPPPLLLLLSLLCISLSLVFSSILSTLSLLRQCPLLPPPRPQRPMCTIQCLCPNLGRTALRP